MNSNEARAFVWEKTINSKYKNHATHEKSFVIAVTNGYKSLLYALLSIETTNNKYKHTHINHDIGGVSTHRRDFS